MEYINGLEQHMTHSQYHISVCVGDSVPCTQGREERLADGEEAITGPMRERRAGIITLVPVTPSFTSTSGCPGRAVLCLLLALPWFCLVCDFINPSFPGGRDSLCTRARQVSQPLETPVVAELRGFADGVVD